MTVLDLTSRPADIPKMSTLWNSLLGDLLSENLPAGFVHVL